MRVEVKTIGGVVHIHPEDRRYPILVPMSDAEAAQLVLDLTSALEHLYASAPEANRNQ